VKTVVGKIEIVFPLIELPEISLVGLFKEVTFKVILTGGK